MAEFVLRLTLEGKKGYDFRSAGRNYMHRDWGRGLGIDRSWAGLHVARRWKTRAGIERFLAKDLELRRAIERGWLKIEDRDAKLAGET